MNNKKGKTMKMTVQEFKEVLLDAVTKYEADNDVTIGNCTIFHVTGTEGLYVSFTTEIPKKSKNYLQADTKENAADTKLKV
jgi:hypothetical protein